MDTRSRWAVLARIALDAGRVGLPATTLGLIPGARGTQRLPRLVGAAKALDMIATGRQVSAAAALGMIDQVVTSDLTEAARVLIATLSAPLPRSRDRKPWFAGEAESAARAAFEARTTALSADPAPATLAAVSAVRDAFDTDFDTALMREMAAFHQLRQGPEAQALLPAFLAERDCVHVQGIGRDTARHTIQRVAILGAGTMGGGIAMTMANAGYHVTMIETEAEALEAACRRIEGVYEGQVARRRISPAAAEAALGRFDWVVGLEEDVKQADLVIEAVYEDMA